MKIKSFIFVFLFIFVYEFLHAQLRMPSILSDHMVVQHNSEFPVWGWSEINDQIRVKASWDNIELKGVCSHEDGRWIVHLKTPQSGGPYTIEVKSPYKTIVLSDVMVGEVWICSGQSNMEFKLPAANGGKEEIALAIPHPEIRFFKLQKAAADYPTR